jgi:hypothetical protein
MRNTFLSLVATLAFAGCGNSPPVNNFEGGGVHDLSVADAPPGVDIGTSPIGCMDLIACTNACTTQACITKCHKMATAHANQLNMALDQCITAYCVTAPDGGMGPCNDPTMQTQCNACVMNTQSGTSPTGMKNGTCTPANDPVCGFCVDQLIACANDLTM